MIVPAWLASTIARVEARSATAWKGERYIIDLLERKERLSLFAKVLIRDKCGFIED